MLAQTNKTCEDLGHDFVVYDTGFGEYCRRCGMNLSERAYYCRCQSTVGRGEVTLAHIYEDEIKCFFLAEMYGLRCESCGMNWFPFQTMGGDFQTIGYPLKDICQSEAEVAFYERYLRPIDQIIRFLPQVFLPLGNNYGYFADFADVHLRHDVEIDGKYHLTRIDKDKRRDEAIARYGMKVVRHRVKRNRAGNFEF